MTRVSVSPFASSGFLSLSNFPLSLNNVCSSLSYFIYTLYLFTKGDIPTLLIPTIIYGTLASRDFTPSHIVHRTIWVWVNLLFFCVSNQVLHPEEDVTNKPWRPVPASRISLPAARNLRWALMALAIVVSAAYGVLEAGVALALATLAHNELKLGEVWYSRYALVALGYAGFNWGATFVSAPSGSQQALAHVLLQAQAQLISGVAITTTIFAQDFRDVDGDRKVGRWTIPMASPSGSRVAIAALIAAWSAFLPWYWRAGATFASVFAGYGACVAARFFCARTQEADRVSYHLYNVWLCMIYAMSIPSSVAVSRAAY